MSLPAIKPLQWDQRRETLSVCHFLGTTYVICSDTGPYTLTSRGETLYQGRCPTAARFEAHRGAQREIAEVLA
jgi:hypothetical protein